MSVWKAITDIHYKVSGAWKKTLSVSYKVSGAWKKCWPDIPANMIVLFKAVPGSPWTVVSSPALNDKYGKCHTAQGSAGGSHTHTHASSGFATNYPAGYDLRLTGIYKAMMSGYHLHSFGHGHTAAVNHEPQWYGLCPAIGGYSIPVTGYIFYDGFVDPDGWESDDTLFNRYIKFKTSSPGGMGGASTHQHYIALNTEYKHQYNDNSGLGTAHQHYANHRHTANHTHTSSNNLYYRTLRPIHPKSVTLKIPSGAVALFIGNTVPSGWTQFSDVNDRYIKMMSYGGVNGGALTHVEDHNGMYTGYFSGSTCNPRGTGTASIPGSSHRHPLQNYQQHISATLEPEYQQLLICKKD